MKALAEKLSLKLVCCWFTEFHFRLTPRRASSHPVAPLIVKSSNEDPEINESVAASVDEENTNEVR